MQNLIIVVYFYQFQYLTLLNIGVEHHTLIFSSRQSENHIMDPS